MEHDVPSQEGSASGRSAIARAKWILAATCLALFLVGFAVLSIFIKRRPFAYDEGLLLVGASRVLNGEIPYKDFWTIYSPGQFYAVALFFKLFGMEIASERYWDLLCRSAIPVLSYVLAARVSSRVWGLLAWGMVLGWVAYYSFPGYTVFPGTAFALAAFVFLIGYCSNPTRLRLIAAGAFVGFAALFRIDFGLYCGLTGIIALVIAFRRSPDLFASSRRMTALSGVAVFLLSAFAVFLPAALYLLVSVPTRDLVEDLLIFPLTVYPKYRGLPMPAFSLTNCYLYLGPICLVIALIIGLRSRDDRRSLIQGLTLTMLSVFGLLSLIYVRVRWDSIHTCPFMVPTAIVLAIFMARPGSLLPYSRTLQAGIRVGAALVFVAMSYSGFLWTYGYVTRLLAEPGPVSDLPRMKSILVTPQMGRVVSLIKQMTRPGEYIFVGTTASDLLMQNEPIYYFLCDRPCPTKYDELHPGSATTAAVQQEIVNGLESHRVRVVLLTQSQSFEPNESSVSSGVTLLESYLRSHFKPVYADDIHLVCVRTSP